jgi:hypothetical protein
MKNDRILALVALSMAFACKGGSSLHDSPGLPTLAIAQGGVARLSCGDPQPDPANPSDPPIVTCTLDFGGVPIGQVATANLTLGNDGVSPYRILSTSTPANAQFAVQPLSFPVQVFSSISLAVSFSPFDETALSDSFTLTTDSSSIGKMVVRLTGSGTRVAISVNPTSIDFGRVIVHSTETRTLTVTNLSTGPVSLGPLEPQGNSASLFSVTGVSADFTQTYQDGMAIPPTKSVTFDLTFTPTRPSSADELGFVVVTYASEKFVNVGLKGFGVQSGLCVTTGPVLINPPKLSFGHVPLNHTLTDFIYVSNCSNETLKLYDSYLAQSDGDIFTVAPTGSAGCAAPLNCQQIKPTDPPYTLNPGDVLTYPITFAPLQGQGYQGQFAVSDDHGDNLTVPISGGGGGPDIACALTLVDFGEVAVGVGDVYTFTCTNTGNDITIGGKISPDAELQVLQSGLTIEQTGTAFSAQLMVDGLATEEVSLRAGQQFQVQVNYDPVAPNSGENAVLDIANNSTIHPLLRIMLRSEGALTLTDCNLAISPASLDFQQIAPGQTVQLPVALTNAGNAPCLVNGLALSPSTDPAFTLLSSSPPSIKLCGATEPASDNCTSPNGTSYQVLVQFAPQADGDYQGLVDFVVSSHSAPSQIVPLSGSASGGCFLVDPQEMDFGNVGINTGTTYCKTASRQIRALNTCNSPVEVTGLTNSAQSTAFRITSSPQLPAVVQPGQFFAFDEQFAPTSAGTQYGSANIVAAPVGSANSQSYLAAFLGTASQTRQQVDSYLIPPSKVDILWVVDFQNIFGMAQIMGLNPDFPGSGLAQSLGSYFGALSGVDYHVGVISAVDCTQLFAFGPPSDFVPPAGGGLAGSLQILPCSGCTDGTGNNAQVITSSDLHPDTEMLNILNAMVQGSSNFTFPGLSWYEGNCNVGTFPLNGGDLFQPAYDALTAQVLSGHNAGFLRPDAALVLVALNMEDDTSTNLTGQPQSFYLSYFQALKGFDPLTPFIVNAVSITPQESAARQSTCPGNNNLFLNGVYYPDVNIPAAVAATSGQLVDVCTSDWGSALTSLGQTSAAKLTKFALGGSPVNPPTGIQVSIASNGGPPVIIPQYGTNGGAAIWTYDATSNSITFANPVNAPSPGDTLALTYDNVCY